MDNIIFNILIFLVIDISLLIILEKMLKYFIIINEETIININPIIK